MVRDIITNQRTPAWVSAIVALVVGGVAVWSFASAPSQATLDDHEERLRTVEHLTASQLAAINAQLKSLTDEVRHLRGGQNE